MGEYLTFETKPGDVRLMQIQWCGLWADRTVKSDYKQRVLDGNHGTEDDLEEIAATFREMEKKEDGWFAVINGQIICHVR